MLIADIQAKIGKKVSQCAQVHEQNFRDAKNRSFQIGSMNPNDFKRNMQMQNQYDQMRNKN